MNHRNVFRCGPSLAYILLLAMSCDVGRKGVWRHRERKRKTDGRGYLSLPLYPSTATAMVSRKHSTYNVAIAARRAQSFLHLVHSVPSWIPKTKQQRYICISGTVSSHHCHHWADSQPSSLIFTVNATCWKGNRERLWINGQLRNWSKRKGGLFWEDSTSPLCDAESCFQ